MKKYSKIYGIAILIIAALMIVLTFGFYHRNNVRNIPFWQFDTSYIVIQLVSLFLIAMFIERTVEVLIIVWREKAKTEIMNRIGKEKTKPETISKGGVGIVTQEESQIKEESENYKAETKTIAIQTAFILGVIISVAGIRILQPLVDPAVFKQLNMSQQRLFTCLDVIVTGALLGGGSNGIHGIIEAFLNTVEKYRDNLKGK